MKKIISRAPARLDIAQQLLIVERQSVIKPLLKNIERSFSLKRAKGILETFSRDLKFSRIEHLIISPTEQEKVFDYFQKIKSSDWTPDLIRKLAFMANILGLSTVTNKILAPAVKSAVNLTAIRSLSTLPEETSKTKSAILSSLVEASASIRSYSLKIHFQSLHREMHDTQKINSEDQKKIQFSLWTIEKFFMIPKQGQDFATYYHA